MTKDQLASHSDLELDRTQIAIDIEDLPNRRLIEGLATQLHLTPVVANDGSLNDPERLSKIALLVADEKAVCRYRTLPTLPDHSGEGVRPAFVAVVSSSYTGNTLLPRKSKEQPFDGILVLPQIPNVVLAQLSVILYAHRATVKRFASALEELHLNRKIFRSVTSGISIADVTKPDMPLTYVNPAFEVITGYTFEEIAGKNCRFLQRDERDQPGRTLVKEAIAEQRSTVAILKNFRKDGTAFWNELSMSPIFDRDGKLSHYVGIQNDVTARVAFEEALRESEKLAATGRLAASIAHEINNPLEAVTNLLYLARNETTVPEKDVYLDQAEQELKRVSLLTTQSLRFYKQSSKPRAVRLVDIVSAVLDVYSVKLNSWGLYVERRNRTEDSIVCLESEIRQVLSNLIRNAMDAMRDGGGRLCVRIRRATHWSTEAEGIAIAIADTGVGMSEETRNRLFQAFYTTKEEHGTGLGLWLSQEIITRHHGSITCKSSQHPAHRGSVFVLFLPFQAINPDQMDTSAEFESFASDPQDREAAQDGKLAP